MVLKKNKKGLLGTGYTLFFVTIGVIILMIILLIGAFALAIVDHISNTFNPFKEKSSALMIDLKYNEDKVDYFFNYNIRFPSDEDSLRMRDAISYTLKNKDNKEIVNKLKQKIELVINNIDFKDKLDKKIDTLIIEYHGDKFEIQMGSKRSRPNTVGMLGYYKVAIPFENSYYTIDIGNRPEV